MEWVKKRRQELGLSQLELAKRTGLSDKRLSDLEIGLFLPNKDVAQALGQSLQLEGLPNASQLLPPKVLRRLTRLKPYQLPAVNVGPWQRMEKRFHWLLGRVKAPTEVLAWIRRFLASESPPEGLSLYQLAAAGARPLLANPHACGYRNQAILDPKGEALGERLLPALYWKQPEFECVMWPQVTVHTGFRLDLLVLLRVNKVSLWTFVEIDGPQHDEKSDAVRTKLLGLSAIRVSTEDVKKLQYAQILAAEFMKLPTKRDPS